MKTYLKSVAICIVINTPIATYLLFGGFWFENVAFLGAFTVAALAVLIVRNRDITKEMAREIDIEDLEVFASTVNRTIWTLGLCTFVGLWLSTYEFAWMGYVLWTLLGVSYLSYFSALITGLDRRRKHPDDEAVDRFARMMKTKMRWAREKGRGGWDDPEEICDDELSAQFHQHLSKYNKSNRVDLANYLMMLELRAALPELPGYPSENER